ncbi:MULTISPECIES: polyamine aminopropyltransferase [unclassified Streptomyces]|uniref:polyamine aminopropyltransferase n=1 Tax=unclassified Streptomyces TaxID=2593676 RepID=UPI00036B78DB|nr:MULTISPECIES: polyamine aminopropyltransferase [unclassified Streptomyces]MYT30822.1 polyamine aminopropyltransferase [Streptomyces sp. SID8354]
MIDPPEPLVAGSPGPSEALTPARLPVPSALGRLLVLAAVFVCAACGLVYELELVALASYLIGDSVTQASVVLSFMVFAMGVGALLAKRLRCRAAIGFGAVEAVLALVGGGSAMALYACFAWLGQSRSALVGFSLGIGVLIGAEIPLLMTLIQRVRRQDAGGAVADLFAADYVGALVGGLAFPFLLLPCLGQLTGALVTGAVNLLAGAVLVLWLFGRDLTTRARWALGAVNVLVLALLGAGVVLAGPFEQAARRAVYGAPARIAEQTGVQEVVLTGGMGGAPGGGAGSGRGRKGSGSPLELFLDGRLKVDSGDERVYHQALVGPAMAGGAHGRVLVLGGGDGLAVRELLRYRSLRSVTVVEIDPEVVRLARTDPGLSALNRHALGDPRVRVVTADAFNWLRGQGRSAGRRPVRYDVIVSDLPDPGITASTKLYSQEFYGLAARMLAPGGRLVVHAGPPQARPRTYWTVEATLRSVGLRTLPYRIPIPGRRSGFSAGPDRSAASFAPPNGPGPAALSGTPQYWGFVLTARRPPSLGTAPDAPPTALSLGALRTGRRDEARERIPGLPPSTLMHPRYLQ